MRKLKLVVKLSSLEKEAINRLALTLDLAPSTLARQLLLQEAKKMEASTHPTPITEAARKLTQVQSTEPSHVEPQPKEG